MLPAPWLRKFGSNFVNQVGPSRGPLQGNQNEYTGNTIIEKESKIEKMVSRGVSGKAPERRKEMRRGVDRCSTK